ncbi:MAG TPA: helix-turn-helix transcriptional regulator [Mucilaginibacter sp.]|nr:helix-turn-helix transcriptional regulator [Mucilaginibacter sp.]
MRDEKSKSYLKAFGEHLNKLRIDRNLSYRKMALKCKIDHSDIKKYEEGETNITLLTLLELAKGLGVEAKELLDF